MLDRAELPGYNVAILTRVSDPSQKMNASLDRQDRKVLEEFNVLEDKHDAEIIETFRLAESASSMDRESLDQILKMGQNDEIDVLMVWAVHRLTRANPWETVEYLLKLREANIILYSDRDGYYDWNDPDDADRIMDRITSSRDWRNEIVRGSRNSCRDRLERGEWPYGPLPYGLVKDENDNIDIKSGHEWIPQEVFEQFVDLNDREAVSEQIAVEIDEHQEDIDPPTEHQIDNILGNELYTGKLELKPTGDLIRELDSLKLVDPELFNIVQELRAESTGEDQSAFDQQEFPDFVETLISRFGQEYVEQSLTGIRWCCPICQSVDINISETEIEKWGINVPKVYCHDSNCSYNGPVIRLKELMKMDSTVPMVCPECQRTGNFDAEPINIEEEQDGLYKYTCNHCEEFIIKDSHPDSLKLAPNNSNAIELKEESTEEINEPIENETEAKRNLKKSSENRIEEEEAFEALNAWFEEHFSDSESLQEVMYDAAKILHERGPLKAEELRTILVFAHNEKYSSPKSMWSCTVERRWESTPGFEKVDHGVYDFTPNDITFFIRWGNKF